eukprot:scaffold53559_cov66-Phaeocystis_antarctica.AAC.11
MSFSHSESRPWSTAASAEATTSSACTCCSSALYAAASSACTRCSSRSAAAAAAACPSYDRAMHSAASSTVTKVHILATALTCARRFPAAWILINPTVRSAATERQRPPWQHISLRHASHAPPPCTAVPP